MPLDPTLPNGTPVNGQGIAPYLLQGLMDVTLGSTPSKKLDNLGAFALLQAQSKPEVLQLGKADGHFKTAQIKYRQRLTEDQTSDTIDCDATNQSPYLQANVTLNSYRQIAMLVDDQLIAQLESIASSPVQFGTPNSSVVLNELYQIFLTCANAINSGVDTDLFTEMVSNVGVNRVTGNNAAKSINIQRDATINDLSDGLTELMTDYQLNSASGKPQIVGSGNLHKWALKNKMVAAANQAGLDPRTATDDFDFYLDQKAPTILGANEVIVYEPNAVQIVEYMRYRGFRAKTIGQTTKGTVGLPIQYINQNGELVTDAVMYDYKLKYFDCDRTHTDAYSGTTINVAEGWNLIVSKTSGLFPIPDNAFRPSDDLAGNRGSYRYNVTNV